MPIFGIREAEGAQLKGRETKLHKGRLELRQNSIREEGGKTNFHMRDGKRGKITEEKWHPYPLSPPAYPNTQKWKHLFVLE